MMLTPPDMVQSAVIAAFLQVLQRVPEATLDVARSTVSIPPGYDLHRISAVPSMMRARRLICPTAVCRSRRAVAKASKSHAYTLICPPDVAADYLQKLRERLGTEYVVVTDAAMTIAKPRVVARVRRIQKDTPGQMLLPLGD